MQLLVAKKLHCLERVRRHTISSTSDFVKTNCWLLFDVGMFGQIAPQHAMKESIMRDVTFLLMVCSR